MRVSKRAAALGLAVAAIAAAATHGGRAAQGVEVSGQVATEDGRPLISGTLAIGRDDAPAAAMADAASFRPDGRFTFRGVRPGRDMIRARGETEPRGVTYFATCRLTVEDRDVGNLTMMLVRGAVLTGSLERRTVRGTRPPSHAALRVRAPLNDGSGFGDALTGNVDRSGRFSIRGLINGAHAISVEGLPAPWAVEKVTFRGRDTTNVPFNVDGRADLRDLRITISDVAPTPVPR